MVFENNTSLFIELWRTARIWLADLPSGTSDYYFGSKHKGHSILWMYIIALGMSYAMRNCVAKHACVAGHAGRDDT